MTLLIAYSLERSATKAAQTRGPNGPHSSKGNPKGKNVNQCGVVDYPTRDGGAQPPVPPHPACHASSDVAATTITLSLTKLISLHTH
jgi:hypothetical protein